MKKRFLAMLLAAAMTMSLCSCGKKSGGDNGNGSGGNSTTEEKVDIKQVTFRAADDQLKFDGVEGEIDNAVRFGDNLVFSTYSWTEGEAVASEADAERELGVRGRDHDCSAGPEAFLQHVCGTCRRRDHHE